jgi:predicted dehydrogenase
MTAAASMRVAGANNRVRAGLIGSGLRGQYLTGKFVEFGAEVAAVCDVYQPNLAAGLGKAQPGATGYTDYRKMLEDKSLDAVIIATPAHWHAAMLIAAVEAGKDVYQEKPMALRVADSQRMVEAARSHRRVVQVGTQRRSNPLFEEAAAILQSGAAGEVRLVNAWWYNTRKAVDSRPLEGKLDWDMWLGPAPKRPFDPARFRDWQYFDDYAGGLMCEQGAHIIDAIQMLMKSTFPVAVTCAAGRPAVEGAEFPETTVLSVQFPENYLAVFTCGYKAMRYAFSLDQMKQFNGSLARFDVSREAYALYPQTESVEMPPSRRKQALGSFERSSGAHVSNFLDCVRSRQDPHATVEMGMYTSIVLSMALESLRTGRRIRWDAASGRAVA